MDPLTTTAASGLRARLESLDMLANNLANVETGGYKADREFYGLYVSADAEAASLPPSSSPQVERHWTDFTAGTLRATSNPLDVAINGKGFFTVAGPSEPLYTRNGSFRLSPAGELITQDGYPVRAAGGGRIVLQAGKPFEIGGDGTVRQDGRTVGRLEVVDFDDTAVLAKQSGAYFRNSDPQVQPRPAAAAEVHQGRIENSNVSSAEAAVRLVSVLRQFETLQKAITIGSEMNRRSVEEVARVQS